jgi:hypothetical protein
MTDGSFESLFKDFLPHWADKELEGELVLYAQLNTKDGRRMGNGVITRIVEEEDLPPVLAGFAPLFTVLTDFGHIVHLTGRDIGRYFHPPMYRMKKSRVAFRGIYMEGYTEAERQVIDEA